MSKEKEKERKENEVESPVDSVRAQAHSVKRGNYELLMGSQLQLRVKRVVSTRVTCLK